MCLSGAQQQWPAGHNPTRDTKSWRINKFHLNYFNYVFKRTNFVNHEEKQRRLNRRALGVAVGSHGAQKSTSQQNVGLLETPGWGMMTFRHPWVEYASSWHDSSAPGAVISDVWWLSKGTDAKGYKKQSVGRWWKREARLQNSCRHVHWETAVKGGLRSSPPQGESFPVSSLSPVPIELLYPQN